MGSSPIISSKLFARIRRTLCPAATRGSNSVVESQPSKLLVAGPIPVSRSKASQDFAQENTSLGTLYQQAVIPVADPASFGAVRTAIDTGFSSTRVADFLRSIDRSGLRVREFESVLDRGLLGPESASQYARLGNADQGQLRELYLAALERVSPDLRHRFFKLYAYY